MFEDNSSSSRLDAVRLRQKEEYHVYTPPASLKPKTAFWRRRKHPGRSFLLTKKFWIALFFLALATAGWIYGTKAMDAARKIFGDRSPISFISGFGQLITSNDARLTGEREGEIRVLLLGIGGEGHEGALLTDTIMVATIRPPKQEGDTGEMSLLSIPRDYVVPLPMGLDYRKINSAYAYGELGNKKLGFTWIKQAVESVTGTDIPYYALIDFSGFKKAIDDAGGVDVDVERSFSDSSYPDYRHGYLPTVKFEKGLQHMDGERALIYARSRHGTNGEGSDFARSRRQAKIMAALKEKILKMDIASSIPTITRLIGTFTDHFKTNMQPWEMKRLYDIGRNVKDENILSITLDPTTDLVCNSIDPVTSAYILSRCPGVLEDDIHRFVKNQFELARLSREAPVIEIQNSTKNTGLAQRAKTSLVLPASDIRTGNYPAKTAQSTTVVYDMTGGKKPFTLAYLQTKLGATLGSDYPYADQLILPKPDFVVVLGIDATTSEPVP